MPDRHVEEWKFLGLYAGAAVYEKPRKDAHERPSVVALPITVPPDIDHRALQATFGRNRKNKETNHAA